MAPHGFRRRNSANFSKQICIGLVTMLGLLMSLLWPPAFAPFPLQSTPPSIAASLDPVVELIVSSDLFGTPKSAAIMQRFTGGSVVFVLSIMFLSMASAISAFDLIPSTCQQNVVRFWRAFPVQRLSRDQAARGSVRPSGIRYYGRLFYDASAA
jgi:hypothetical protein